MAKRAKSPPLPGDVFAMRLDDGRFGACRILRKATPNEKAPNHVVVAASAYIENAPPSIEHPDVRRVLVLNHHRWKDHPEIAWVNGAPPPDRFTRIGHLEPTDAERTIVCNHWGGWLGLPLQVLMQWRWIHDRDAVLAEDEVEGGEEQRRFEEGLRRRLEELDRLTYASFRRKKLFESWTDYAPKEMQAAARKVMKETASKLEALSPKPNRRKARAILKNCIVAFNKLDEENGHWITTIEREDICEVFYQLAHLAGFDDEPELADEWRDF